MNVSLCESRAFRYVWGWRLKENYKLWESIESERRNLHGSQHIHQRGSSRTMFSSTKLIGQALGWCLDLNQGRKSWKESILDVWNVYAPTRLTEYFVRLCCIHCKSRKKKNKFFESLWSYTKCCFLNILWRFWCLDSKYILLSHHLPCYQNTRLHLDNLTLL